MEVTVDIDTDELTSEIMDNIDYSDIADTVMDKIDYDDIASNVIDNMSYSDMAEYVVREIDYSDLASEVRDYIEIEDDVHNLLDQYDPTRNCSTGNAFTKAVKKAIEYLNSVSAAEAVVLEIPDQIVAVPEQESVEVPVVDSPTVSDVSEVVITNGEKAKLKDIGITMTKRVVNELFNQYVPDFGTDPLMRIRLEAKAFDILNEEFDKEFSV
jgi:hypothetical protein